MKINPRYLVLSVLITVFACVLQGANSISQYGITWTFDADYQVGQYANGDYYIVAPSGLTITGISPASTIVALRTIDGGGTVSNTVVNGSMVNPTASNVAPQGFDSAITGYQASLNAARPGGNDLSASNPLVLPAGSSLISSISNPIVTRPGLTDAAILTVVSSAPSSGSFRPPYCGSDKTHYWNKASLNYGILRSLTPVGSTPTLSTVEGYLQRPWIEINTDAGGRYYHPSNNQPDYGGNMAKQLAYALLSLHLNYTNIQKEPLYIRIVQYGIDVYGAAKSGANWPGNGGHNMGRKMPMLLAGIALNDENILSYANAAQHFIFQEDHQTFVVDEAELLVVPYTGDGRLRSPYTADMLNTPEWGEKHDTNKTRDGSNWDVYYRNVNYGPLLGHALMAHLTTTAMTIWNWQVFFDYHDRVAHLTTASDFDRFIYNMWAAYRSLDTTPVTIVAPSNAKIGVNITQ